MPPISDPRAYLAACLERDRLAARLEDGWEKCERGRREGRDVAAWEDHWIALLRQYEAICNRLADADEAA